jgi:hypothetical protein
LGYHLRYPNLLSLDSGLLSLDSGLLSLDSGLLSLDSGLLSVHSGLPSKTSLKAGLPGVKLVKMMC